MTFALIENGNVVEYPIYEGDIKLRFPNVSFAIPFSPPSGFEPVVDVVPPSITHEQNLAEGKPEFVNNTWKRTWVVSDATPEEIQKRTEQKAAQIRKERNRRLEVSDWTQLGDSPLDADGKLVWQLYRETLRMIPDQAGFPWNVNWPPSPSGEDELPALQSLPLIP